nr:DegT/DnrJ/EryC1/StrS family aminotransferase [Methylocystis sp. ATCC 49242]
MRPKLPVADQILPYLRYIDVGRTYSNGGPLVAELETRITRLLRSPAGGIVCTGSGTAALVCAILASSGRARAARPLAIVPGYTFIATASAVEQCGYRPYLVDVDEMSWMLDPERLIAHPLLDHVGVIVPVASFGKPPQQEAWRRFARRTGIPIVIDAAASFEACVASPEQAIGDIPIALSFHATKSFATGEGGAVVTSDIALADRARQAMNFGFYGARNSQMPSINGKMSEYHAAVGLASLDSLYERQAAFRAVADCYRRYFNDVTMADNFHGFPEVAGCYALYLCQTSAETTAVHTALERFGVDFRLWYGSGLHNHAYYKDVERDELPVTEDLARRLVGVPVACDLSASDVSRVVAAIADGVRRDKIMPSIVNSKNNAIVGYA